MLYITYDIHIIPQTDLSVGVLAVLVIRALGQCWTRSRKPRTTFVRRRGTSCMSPSPLCGEIGRSRTFDRKTHMNLSDFASKTHLASQGCQACLWEASWSLLDRYSDQIWAKVLFLENGHVSKFQKCLFFRNKSPCGSILTKGTFFKLTCYELIHFCYDLKKWLSQFSFFW